MKIPKDMKATSVDEAVAMKLTAEQMHHNVQNKQDSNIEDNHCLLYTSPSPRDS